MASSASAILRSFACIAALILHRNTAHAAQSSLSSRQINPHILTDGIRYITRPDIDAPRWNIVVYDKENYSPGYWFVATYDYLDQTITSGGLWNAPHIFDNYGELIWSGSYISQRYDSFDFKLSNVLGEKMLTWLYPRNQSVMTLDNGFTARQTFIAYDARYERENMHELRFVANGTRALYFYSKTSLVDWNGVRCHVDDCCFRDRNLLTEEVEFEWCSTDHLGLNESTYGDPDLRCIDKAENYDFLHANSLDKFPESDNSYLMSGRYTDTIYKIAPNGTVIWRLGGKYSDFVTDFKFQRQHHARIHSHNDTHTLLSIFDNAISEELRDGSSPYSRGLIFVLNTSVQPMTATFLAEYPHPWGEAAYTAGRGSTQLLPNGNVFQCWVDSCLHSEHTANGTLIMEGWVKQDWLKSYRSYKFDFVGRPDRPPDIHSTVQVQYGETKTIVHASWNGATEVASWKLFTMDPEGTERTVLAEVPRTGFETRLEYDGFAKYVQVSAYDKDHKFLGWSQIFATLSGDLTDDNDVLEHEMSTGTDSYTNEATLNDSFGGHPSSWTAKLTSPIGRGFVVAAVGFIVAGIVLLIIGRKFLVAKSAENERKGWSKKQKDLGPESYDSESEDGEDGEDELFIPFEIEKP